MLCLFELQWSSRLLLWHSKHDPCQANEETLYSALLFQDISFFDNETVGDLTSRLGADCQQVSRVIGNDLNLILRNVLQGTGALIYLLVLSWPLGLCTMMICSTLLIIMLLYGR
ncbi:ABC transporter B family member 26, chloroplastic [Vitis vinifera]|uniref:ABC transporter B family member 26, chloroplastic n=1 Tax=Vitis vinifera TaxID=29760 RepID=A0A438J5R1_VITVI|nr:ABC transporter B family member 26, chloroplastic [Vitis vinifera]